MKLTITAKKRLYKGKFMEMWATGFVDRAGEKQVWEYTSKHPPVTVFPITRHGDVILIQSFRIPLNAYVIETPAGLRDVPDEKVEETARRELAEETGYSIAGDMYRLPDWPYRSGSSQDVFSGFIATNVWSCTNPQLEAAEDIEVLVTPYNDLVDLYLESRSKDKYFVLEILGMAKTYEHLCEQGKL